MVELVKCLECGEEIEENIQECSHCHTQHPSGVKCLVCFEILKESDAVKYENDKTGLVKYFHPECYGKFKENYARSSEEKKPLTLEPINPYNQYLKTPYLSKSNWSQQASLKKIESDVIWKRFSKFITIFLLGSFLLSLWGVFFYLMLGDMGIIVGLLTTMFMMVPIIKGL